MIPPSPPPSTPGLKRHSRTLLVVAAEAALERLLVHDARERGAQFWTIGEVHGAGRDGARDGDWEADRTIEMKVVCDAVVAQALAAHILSTYAPHYSVSLYMSEVAVLRPERF